MVNTWGKPLASLACKISSYLRQKGNFCRKIYRAIQSIQFGLYHIIFLYYGVYWTPESPINENWQFRMPVQRRDTNSYVALERCWWQVIWFCIPRHLHMIKNTCQCLNRFYTHVNRTTLPLIVFHLDLQQPLTSILKMGDRDRGRLKQTIVRPNFTALLAPVVQMEASFLQIQGA